ncbi:MAG: CinA family protein [Acidimicrobiia bacterium]
MAIIVTGSAGPDPQEQPVRTMIIAAHTRDRTQARTLRMRGDRERIRTYTTTGALHLARLALTGRWWSGPPQRGRWL